MSWTAQVLVVANETAGALELRRALEARAERGPAAFTLLMPVERGLPSEPDAGVRLEEVLSQLRAAGLRIDGRLGHCDPVVAVAEAWDPQRFDEVIVATLPRTVSRWLGCGLPRRIAHLTDVPVAHVEVRLSSVPAMA